MAILPEPKTEEQIKKIGLADLRKEYTKIASVYNHIKDFDYLLCHKCGTYMSTEAFYKDNDYATGYFPVCNKCLAKMATDYDYKTNTYTDNKEKTMKTLQFMDKPFIESVYNSALATVQNDLGERSKSTAWRQMIVMLQSLHQYRGLKWRDSQYEDDSVIELADERHPRAEIKKIFGSGFTESDYLYLQDQYDDWRARTQVDSKSQETYIVRICFKLLDIWKAQKAGKDTKDLDKSLNDLMAAANLQPKQNVANAATDSLSFSELIEKWELEKPIPEPSPEFKDVDGIGKYLRVWFAGFLANALGLKNMYSQEYEDEIKKYTVERKDVAEDGAGTSDQIYEQIFGSTTE